MQPYEKRLWDLVNDKPIITEEMRSKIQDTIMRIPVVELKRIVGEFGTAQRERFLWYVFSTLAMDTALSILQDTIIGPRTKEQVVQATSMASEEAFMEYCDEVERYKEAAKRYDESREVYENSLALLAEQLENFKISSEMWRNQVVVLEKDNAALRTELVEYKVLKTALRAALRD